jgi:hypothetical protein
MGNGLNGVLVDPRLQHLPNKQFTTFYMLLKKCFRDKENTIQPCIKRAFKKKIG